MKVYIPFEDGSVVSYDGIKFKLYRQPVGIDANPHALPESKAEYMWRNRRKDIAKALETAWWKERTLRWEKRAKKIYSKHENSKDY